MTLLLRRPMDLHLGEVDDCPQPMEKVQADDGVQRESVVQPANLHLEVRYLEVPDDDPLNTAPEHRLTSPDPSNSHEAIRRLHLDACVEQLVGQ